MTDEVIDFEIIVVYDEVIQNFDIEDILSEVPNSQLYNVIELNPVKTDLMEKLLIACNENCSDVILIMGNIKSVEKHFVTEAIINICDILPPENVGTLMLDMENSLKIIMSQITSCGLRNQTLIVDLSGENVNPKKCILAIKYTLLKVLQLICTNKDEPVPSTSQQSTSISDNTSPTKERLKGASKRRKKSTSPLVPSPDMIIAKRHKESFPMISLREAILRMQDITFEVMEEVPLETVELSDACGRILRESVEATYDLPPFKTSTKHGYAIADGEGLRKVLNIKKPSSSTSLEPGTCVWVNSGAPVPKGTMAVVPLKNTKLVKVFEDSNDVYIDITVEPTNEENIKPVGYDLTKGKSVARTFARITPTEIALLAASGRKSVLVAKQISIGVLSIGSNLEEFTEPLEPGYVYDINRIYIISLLKEKNYHSLDFGIVENKSASITHKIGEALNKVDLLVTTGSTNDKDSLKSVLENNFKADIHFGNVNIKPSKSTIFATCKINDTTKYFLCLPRNPASVSLGAQMFLFPLVNMLCGNMFSEEAVIPVRMKHQYTLHNRPRIAWTILEWEEGDKSCATAYSKGNTISDKLISAVGANAYLLLPDKKTKSDQKSDILAVLVKAPKRVNNKNFCNASPKVTAPPKECKLSKFSKGLDLSNL